MSAGPGHAATSSKNLLMQALVLDSVKTSNGKRGQRCHAALQKNNSLCVDSDSKHRRFQSSCTHANGNVLICSQGQMLVSAAAQQQKQSITSSSCSCTYNCSNAPACASLSTQSCIDRHCWYDMQVKRRGREPTRRCSSRRLSWRSMPSRWLPSARKLRPCRPKSLPWKKRSLLAHAVLCHRLQCLAYLG